MRRMSTPHERVEAAKRYFDKEIGMKRWGFLPHELLLAFHDAGMRRRIKPHEFRQLGEHLATLTNTGAAEPIKQAHIVLKSGETREPFALAAFKYLLIQAKKAVEKKALDAIRIDEPEA